MSNYHFFHKKDLERILDECLNKSLGEVDSNNVFEITKTHPKYTGIAGHVIEQSVLGYPADTRQEPDLDVDGVKTELKTTGIRYIRNNTKFVAKEPMSITAVSPDIIVNETFDDSNFWHKLAHLLFVYYLYYPRISYELRPKLMYIDTAPKWPNNPRFRLKRSVVSSIVQDHFGETLEQLPKTYTSYSEINETCHELTNQYKGKAIHELIDLLDISVRTVNKGIGEHIIVKMFGGTSKKMQNIKLFNKLGIIGKTLTLTERGLRKEDMKLFTIDFSEFTEDAEFEDSQIYDYFANNRFLCIIFQRPHANAKWNDNIFLGFKMINFDGDFIENDVRNTWERIKDLIVNDKLEDVIVLDKHGQPRKNSSGNIMSAPNFPKSSEGNVFVRGTSSTSDVKPLTLNGIKMYRQQMWVKGLYIVEKLDSEDYI